MNRNQLYWVLGIVIVVAILIWAAAYSAGLSPTASSTPVSATTTAASGSAARAASLAGSGPGNIGGITNPGAPTSTAPYQTFLLQLGTTVTQTGVQVTPIAVVEDSRCPEGAQCVQAGTVEVSVKFAFNGLSETHTFTLGIPQSAYGYTAELTNVRPAKQQGTVISPSDYRFVFIVSKP